MKIAIYHTKREAIAQEIEMLLSAYIILPPNHPSPEAPDFQTAFPLLLELLQAANHDNHLEIYQSTTLQKLAEENKVFIHQLK